MLYGCLSRSHSSTVRCIDQMKHKSTKWKWAFFFSTTVLFIVIAFLVYGIFDQGVTISYMSLDHASTKKDLKRLSDIFPKNYNKKDILFLLRKKNPDAFIVENKCTVQLDGLKFEFDGKGNLTDIKTGAENIPDSGCDDTEPSTARER